MDLVIDASWRTSHRREPFQLPVNIPDPLRRTGQDTWAWALCVRRLIVYALAQFGLASDPAVQRAVEYLVALVRDNGWPCVVSKELGHSGAREARDAPCPFATLAMLKALSELRSGAIAMPAHVGSESLLTLWEQSLDRHPICFTWHGLPASSRCRSYGTTSCMCSTCFPGSPGSGRYAAPGYARAAEGQDGPTGRFTLGVGLDAWKEGEFGQKKEPSRWLTLAAWRIMGRIRAESV